MLFVVLLLLLPFRLIAAADQTVELYLMGPNGNSIRRITYNPSQGITNDTVFSPGINDEMYGMF